MILFCDDLVKVYRPSAHACFSCIDQLRLHAFLSFMQLVPFYAESYPCFILSFPSRRSRRFCRLAALIALLQSRPYGFSYSTD